MCGSIEEIIGAAMTKRPAQVDEADVDQLIDILFKDSPTSSPTDLTAEARAELAQKFALGYAKAKGMSAAWGKELARKVHKRALWNTPSTKS